MSERDRNFIEWLTRLGDQPNGRAVLADLRRGLGRPPGLAPGVGRYVQPFLSAADKPQTEEAYYLIAALYGLHPATAGSGSMGSHFRRLWDEGDPPENVVRRFNILVNADRDMLPDYLRHAVALLKAKEVAINWAQLLDDLLGWENPNGRVQLQWARDFWRKNPAKSGTLSTKTMITSEGDAS